MHPICTPRALGFDADSAAAAAGVQLLCLVPDSRQGRTALELVLMGPRQVSRSPDSDPASVQEEGFSPGSGPGALWTRTSDHALLLLEAPGTAGDQKAFTLGELALRSAAVAHSLALGPSEVCIVMEPLFHAGGVVHCMLAPILSGGCVSFLRGGQLQPDLQAFWGALSNPELARRSWYCSSVAGHRTIVEDARARAGAGQATPNALLRVTVAATAGVCIAPSLA